MSSHEDMFALLRRQFARRTEDEPKNDKMIRDIKKRYELSSIILFPLFTCNFKKQGVLQNITLLSAEFILV
jgi:hypothetical protein